VARKYLIAVLYMAMAALRERERESEGERRDESKYPGSQVMGAEQVTGLE
jgi:hypothetical protein